MKNFIILSSLILMLSSCDTGRTAKTEKSESDSLKIIQSEMDTTPKVTGIGGIFFRSKNPKEVKEWYAKNLGLVTDEYGSTFEFRNASRPDEVNYLQWSVFDEKTKYFDPSEKEFMINYRVQNLEGLIRQFRENGVTILDSIEEYDYGKFVHIMDPEGNKIELWEPVDKGFDDSGKATTK